MKLLKRIFGICETPPPADEGCWHYAGGKIFLKLDRAPELAPQGGAVRLEGKGLPVRVLVIHGEDGAHHALANRCTHMGRRIDPMPGTERVECCSVSKSTFDYGGQPLGGAARKPLQVFSTALTGTELTVHLT